MSTVCLQSSDNVCFVVETRIVNISETIKNMNEFGDDTQISENIPIANVSGNVLEKIIEWATHHVNQAIPAQECVHEQNEQDISVWDLKFMEDNAAIVYDIILAANFLDIKELIDLGCKTVANWIKPLIDDPQKIRETFGIECDFTPEELEQIEMENALACDF